MVLATLGGGVIFSTIIVEFYYLVTSVWRSYLFGMFGFLAVNMTLLLIVISLVSTATTYISLQSLNWQWWWQAYLTGFSAGAYMMLYLIYCMVFVFKMDMLWGDVVYLLYAGLASVMFSLYCASVSVGASYLFVDYIFRKTKND